MSICGPFRGDGRTRARRILDILAETALKLPKEETYEDILKEIRRPHHGTKNLLEYHRKRREAKEAQERGSDQAA